MRINTQKVTTLLDGFSSSIKTPPLLEDGNLDVQKLQLLPETITLIENLKKEGVKTSKALAELGFPAASMIFRF